MNYTFPLGHSKADDAVLGPDPHQPAPPAQERLCDCCDSYSPKAVDFAEAMIVTLGHFMDDLGYGKEIAPFLQSYRAFQVRQQMFVRVKRPPEFWKAGMVAGSFGHFAFACCHQLGLKYDGAAHFDQELLLSYMEALDELRMVVATLLIGGYLPPLPSPSPLSQTGGEA